MAKEIKILGEGKYSVGQNQQFINRKGQLVRPMKDEYGKPKLIPVGKAYLFFECSYSKEEVINEINNIISSSDIPNKLELSLIDGLDKINNQSLLYQILKDAKDKAMNYIFEGTYPNLTNKDTANELRIILNLLLISRINSDDNTIKSEIVYQDSGKYVFCKR
jgi:hypothetical protein